MSAVLRREIQARSGYWIALLRETAKGDDEMLLRLLADHLDAVEAHAKVCRAMRDEAAQRLREAGTPVTRLAVLARVSDSYLARRLFALGSARRRG